jgi:hypothetical protein
MDQCRNNAAAALAAHRRWITSRLDPWWFGCGPRGPAASDAKG